MMLSGNFTTFTWYRWNTSFLFAAKTSRRLIHDCILTDHNGDNPVQYLITNLADLKIVYSEFLN